MSQVFITDIIGTGIYAVPTNPTQLLTAKAGFDSIISGVANLSYQSVDAWVTDSNVPAGPRSLNCSVNGFEFSGSICPNATDTDTMLAAIKSALEADVDITSVSVENVNIVPQLSTPAGAGAYLEKGPYEYTQAATPVEEAFGQFNFEGLAASGLTVVFKASVTPVMTTPGSSLVRLYDLGPVAGPFGTPRLVATLSAPTPVLVVLTQALTVVSSSPTTNQIWSTDRLYEVAAYQNSAENDTLYVGFAGLEIRP